MADDLDKKEESLFVDAAFVVRIPSESQEYKKLYCLFKTRIDKIIHENETFTEFIRVKAIINDVWAKIFYAVLNTSVDPHYFGFLSGKLINSNDNFGLTDSIVKSVRKRAKGIYKTLLNEKLFSGGDECFFESIKFVGMRRINRTIKMLRDLAERFPILRERMRLRDVLEIHYIVDGVRVDVFYAVMKEKEEVRLEFLCSDPILQNFDFTYNNPSLLPILNRAKESYLDERFS
ncbi:hypothetical protein HZA39_04360 [Candidatus Peregrinibacteria bacterium]|nr:hypothetical protein [Candidatus Peregrinibacteria bacterium]